MNLHVTQPSSPNTVRDDTFYRTAGWNAYRLGLSKADCPYKLGTPESAAWLDGHAAARRTKQPPMEVSPKDRPRTCITWDTVYEESTKPVARITDKPSNLRQLIALRAQLPAQPK